MKTEFQAGDLVTFKPYEAAIKAKVLKVLPANKVTSVPNDHRIFYKLVSNDPKRNLKTITTGLNIVESQYYEGAEVQPCR